MMEICENARTVQERMNRLEHVLTTCVSVVSDDVLVLVLLLESDGDRGRRRSAHHTDTEALR